MFVRDGIEYEFHHLGIPTVDEKPGERFSAKFGMFTSDSACGIARIQWHRFKQDSCLDPLVRTVAHPAFKVSDLKRAIEGFRLLLGPYEPIKGFRVAMIEEGGMPVELIEMSLSDDEIWNRARQGDRASIYEEPGSSE